MKGYDAFLRAPSVRDSLKPDVIIRTGNEPVSKGLDLLISDGSDQTIISLFESGGPQNASLTKGLRARVHWPSLDISEIDYRSKEYLNKWQQQSKAYTQMMGDTLNRQSALSDPHIYFDLVKLIPKGFNIVLSNSFPVRDFDMFGNFSGDRQPVLVNRGAAGIDGVTSTAIGASLGLGKGTVLFTGDLAFLHDINALHQVIPLKDNHPILVVVVDNKGGSIFRMLPFDKQDQQFTNLFETPQSVSLKEMARANKARVISVTKRDDLQDGFNSLVNKKGINILLCHTSADESMNIRKSLWK